MASLHQLMAALQAQTQIVTSGLSIFDSALTVEVGLDWPPLNTLQRMVKMRPPMALISVFDRKTSHDSTRWIPGAVASTLVTPLLTSSPAIQPVLPGGSVTITMGGSVQAGDAVSLVVINRAVLQAAVNAGNVSPASAVVATGAATDTPTTMATALAALANAASDVTGVVSVTASGSVLTVTNKLPTAILVESYTGNGGTQTTEIGRRRRDLQLTVWGPSTEVRDVTSDPIEVMIAQMEVFGGSQGQYESGLVLADGSFARVCQVNDFLVDDPVLSDAYRRDFILSADYPVTSVDALYSILAPITSYNISL